MTLGSYAFSKAGAHLEHLRDRCMGRWPLMVRSSRQIAVSRRAASSAPPADSLGGRGNVLCILSVYEGEGADFVASGKHL